MDDDRPTPPPTPLLPGADLSRLSVAEIDTQIELLRREIERLEATRAAKKASQAAADAVFKF